MSLINGDPERRNKFFKILTRFGPLVSFIGYLSGIGFLIAQPHSSLVHRTYMSENALSPGLVSSDIFSTDILFYYNDLLKNHFQSESSKDTYAEFVHDLFLNSVQIESYTQTFNSTDHIEKKITKGTNVYAFGRARRTDGTESVVISAPIFFSDKNGKKVANYGGLAELLFLANIAKSKPYWSKDLIFLVSDGQVGTKAWINSYFNIKSEFVNAENLKKRGGSIQAALNLELADLNIDSLSIKIEGENGKLPNLDLFNTIIKICKTLQFKCALDSEKSPKDYTNYKFDRREPNDYLVSVLNTLNMLFKQATGVSFSSHSGFINYRIEAVTIGSINSVKLLDNKKNFRQSVIKATRIVEGTMRSINNLLERFHQSFFFYLLPSSNLYISIGMYMPSIGLICLPLLIKIITLWCSIFMDTKDETSMSNENTISNLVSLAILSISVGVSLNTGIPFLLSNSLITNLSQKDFLMSLNLTCMLLVFSSPALIKLKMASGNLIKIFILLILLIVLGTLCLLNFSFAFLVSLSFVPASMLAVANLKNKVLRRLRSLLLVLTYPAVYFSILYTVYIVIFENYKINNAVEVYELVSNRLFDLAKLSQTSDIWTLNIINLTLIPIWSSLWCISFA